MFQIVIVALLPGLIGVDGIWLSIVAAELLALFVTGMFLLTKEKTYHYLCTE